MNDFGPSDGGSDFESFLNHEYLAGSTSNDDEHHRGFTLMDSPSTEGQFHSPRSVPSSELSDSMASNSISSPRATPFGAMSNGMGEFSMGLSSFGFDMPAPAPGQWTGPPAFRLGTTNAESNLNLLHNGTQMWRSPSDGAGLSQSISSLALDGGSRLGDAPVLVTDSIPIKEEEDSPFSGFSFAPSADPGELATPMQSSMSLPGTSSSSPSSEKKRKLSVSQQGSTDSSTSVGQGRGTAPSAKAEAAIKKTNKKRANIPSVLASKKDQADDVMLSSQDQLSSDGTKAGKKGGSRRPPPSATQVTEAGKPFPVIDTSAKHSSLFVPPDTSGLTKREARLVKNRAAAFLSRQRKREQFEELEAKCKAMSMMGWRLWEIIAGPGAPVEALPRTVIPSVFSEEHQLVRICLEQIISKKGDNIAPAADDPPMQISRDSMEPGRSATPCADGSEAVADDGLVAEMDKLKSQLVAAQHRESELVSELESMRRATSSCPAPTSHGPLAHAVPLAQVGHAGGFWPVASMPSAPLPGAAPAPLSPPQATAQPFRATWMFDPSITFAPDLSLRSELVSSKSSEGASSLGGQPDVVGSTSKSEDMDTSSDFAATPTIEKFTEAALKNKQAQLSRSRSPSLGLGRQYGFYTPRADTITTPSSPSLSSVSSDNADSRSIQSPPRRTAGSMALMVILFGIALLGMPSGDLAKLGISRANGSLDSGFSLGQVLGPVTQSSRFSLVGSSKEDDDEKDETRAPTARPSSHLSDTDLSLGLEVELRTPIMREHAGFHEVRGEEAMMETHEDLDQGPHHAAKALQDLTGSFKVNLGGKSSGDAYLMLGSSRQEASLPGHGSLALLLPKQTSTTATSRPLASPQAFQAPESGEFGSDESFVEPEFKLKRSERKSGHQMAQIIATSAVAAAALASTRKAASSSSYP